jgi:tubby and related proteins
VVSKSRSARVIGLNQVSPRGPAGNYPVSHISYELNVLGSRYGKAFSFLIDKLHNSALLFGTLVAMVSLD